MPIEQFLHTLSRLKRALDYFERNNPKSIEVENVRSLYEHGGDALSRQFAEVVKKHSRPVPATDILNSISVDEELGVGGSGPASNVTANTAVSGGSGGKDQVDFVSIHHFPEEIQTDLIQIAEWLNLNDHDEFMNIYAKVRGQVTKKSLDQLREHQLSGAHAAVAGAGAGGAGAAGGGTSPGAVRKFSSPSAAGQTPVESGGFGTPTGKKVFFLQADHGHGGLTLDSVDLSFGIPPVCPFGPFVMPSLPDFHLPKQKLADRGTN